MTLAADPVPSKILLAVECFVLFVGVPVVLAVFLEPSAMYPVLTVAGVAGLALLHFTPGFSWRELLGPIRVFPVIAFGVLTFAAASVLCWLILPDRFWFLIQTQPQILLIIALFYPPLLVLPQEIVYRPLFYRRYGPLFPGQSAIWVNAVLFSLGHLMYWHWAVLLLTFVGSFVFSWAYLQDRGFMQTMALHSIAGFAVFASGLGWLFFTGGNVAQGG
ncbi:MAG: CPBP family intramembrane glutamic endopeptidase [Pseudomonadota bacterium]